MTAGLAFGEGEGGVESPPAARGMADGVPELEIDDPESDAGGVLLDSAAGVGPEVEVGGGWPSVRNLLRMLEASLGETVVVVVELRGLANTVTVTVLGSSFGLPLLDGDNEVDVDVLDDVLDDVVELFGPSIDLSEPVMPPLPPAAVIRPRTVFSLVQSRDVPGARMLGMAKHSWLS